MTRPAAPAGTPRVSSMLVKRRELLRPQDASTEGARLLRVLLQRHTAAEVAKRVACNDKSVMAWALDQYRPSRIHRATMARVLCIDPAVWDLPPRAAQAAAP